MPKLRLNLSEETIDILRRVAASIGQTEPEVAITALADQWDSQQDDMPAEQPKEVERKAQVGKVVDETILSNILSPVIALDLTMQQQQTTPRETDGLVPWGYILEGYPDLDFVSVASKYEGTEAEAGRRVEIIREVLTRIPEDKWESEQTRSVIAKAFEALG